MTEPTLPTLPQIQDPASGARPSRARALTGLLLLAAMLGGVWAFGYWEPRLLPVRMIEVQGEVHHHSSEQLRETLVQRLSGGFLTADLADLKQAAQGLPWVGGASIRRVWPDRLQVRVQEHKPVARWKGDGLVTAQGVVFRAGAGTIPAGLPMLEGDEPRARELVEHYLKWRDQLMLAGQLIDTLGVDARGAWRVDLVSKARLELGTNDIEQRLARFINAVPQLDAAGRAELVDLRYSNGFAVKWAGTAATPAAAETAATPKTQVKPPAKSQAQARPKTQSHPRPLAQAKTARPKTPTPAHLPGHTPAHTPGHPPVHPPVQAQAQARPKAPAKAPPHPAHPPAALAPARGLTQAGPAHPETKPQERTGKRG